MADNPRPFASRRCPVRRGRRRDGAGQFRAKQSVAVSLAAILATVAYAGFLPILICFVPMLGIAIGYQRLNAWHTSAGATYSWVGQALNPHAGFLAGWLMLIRGLGEVPVGVGGVRVRAAARLLHRRDRRRLQRRPAAHRAHRRDPVPFQGIAPNGDMQANAGNILAFVGDKIGGGFWKNVMIVTVLATIRLGLLNIVFLWGVHADLHHRPGAQ
jgi:hypothetical protein